MKNAHEVIVNEAKQIGLNLQNQIVNEIRTVLFFYKIRKDNGQPGAVSV